LVLDVGESAMVNNGKLLHGKIYNLLSSNLKSYDLKKKNLGVYEVNYLKSNDGFSLESSLAEVHFFNLGSRIEIHIRNNDHLHHRLSMRLYGKDISKLVCSEVYLHPPVVTVADWPSLDKIYSLKKDKSTNRLFKEATFLSKKYLEDLDFEKHSFSICDKGIRVVGEGLSYVRNLPYVKPALDFGNKDIFSAKPSKKLKILSSQ